jgi:hypothetical protein
MKAGYYWANWKATPTREPFPVKVSYIGYGDETVDIFGCDEGFTVEEFNIHGEITR